MSERATAGVLDVAVASRARPGERASGDRHAVWDRPTGALVAVVDGLGHGEPAARAAQGAIDALAGGDDTSLINLVRHCHRTLAGTRGVVMSLASFAVRDHTLTWLGIGNVAGVLWRADGRTTPALETLLARGGVVGLELPPMQAAILTVASGDLLVLATDGVRPDFAAALHGVGPVQRLAADILAGYGRDSDDALVLVARYGGSEVAT